MSSAAINPRSQVFKPVSGAVDGTDPPSGLGVVGLLPVPSAEKTTKSFTELYVGGPVGAAVGEAVGDAVGSSVGVAVGAGVGDAVGASVGPSVGSGVKTSLAPGVGNGVGARGALCGAGVKAETESSSAAGRGVAVPTDRRGNRVNQRRANPSAAALKWLLYSLSRSPSLDGNYVGAYESDAKKTRRRIRQV